MKISFEEMMINYHYVMNIVDSFTQPNEHALFRMFRSFPEEIGEIWDSCSDIEQFHRMMRQTDFFDVGMGHLDMVMWYLMRGSSIIWQLTEGKDEWSIVWDWEHD